jgi:hypothetical protein
MDYPVEKPAEGSLSAQKLASETQAYRQEAPRPTRNEHGQWLPGVCGNRDGPRGKKPITAILAAYIATPEGRKQVLRAAQKQVRVSAYQPAMATYIRETLEGKLVDRVEIAGGLELAARVARARKRLIEADNYAEEHTGKNE